MKILAIETSCDETAIAFVEAVGDEHAATFSILGNGLVSQIEVHKPYGGVFPALAKREHARNLVPVLAEACNGMVSVPMSPSGDCKEQVQEVLAREEGLADALFEYIETRGLPAIDVISVTSGPGLEPALWVGVNFAKALSLLSGAPIVSAHHMEGHILSALAKNRGEKELVIEQVELPVLALLISGGHTELQCMRTWLSYERIGKTRDDAVGEAFDKVARILGLPYPGGPEVSRLAEERRTTGTPTEVSLPRPMLDSGTCDFSFAGLKTAVLYLAKDRDVSDEEKARIAEEFENAVAEGLVKKTLRALEDTDAQTVVLGGGVSANTHIRRVFTQKIQEQYPGVSLRIPSPSLTTDNAVMIALAGFYRAAKKEFADPTTLTAIGTRPLGE